MGDVRQDLVPRSRAAYVGQDIRRREDLTLVRGQGTFVDDVHVPGLLHVAFLRSPYAFARIGEIQTAAAEALPGVVAVVTGRGLDLEIPSWMEFPGVRVPARPLLARDRALFVGDPVVAVAATDPYVARDALELLEVDFEPMTPVLDAEEALRPEAPRLYPEWTDNVIARRSFRAGDPDGQFARKDALRVSAHVVSHRYSPTPIETRGILAEYDPVAELLRIRASTQFPHVFGTLTSQVLHVPEHHIRVQAGNVGGGFGIKSAIFPDELATCYLAVRLGRPVKWIESRTEHLQVAGHARQQVHDIEGAFLADGTLLAVRNRAVADMGIYGTFWTEVQPAFLTQIHLPGPYRFAHYAYDLTCVVTNKGPYGPHRGFGRPVGTFVIERLLDRAALQLGIDPAELRRRNLVPADAMPYTNAHGVVYDSGDYPRAFARLLESAGYAQLRKRQVQLRLSGRRTGIGLAFYVEYTTPNSIQAGKNLGWDVGGYDSATIRMDSSGKATVQTGLLSTGQAHETIFAQITADELGLPLDDVIVHQGDTRSAPYGFGAWASRGTVVGGGACILAARRLKEKLLAIAAFRLESARDDLAVEDGVVRDRTASGKSISVAELAKIAIRKPTLLPPGMEAGLEVTARYEPIPRTTCSYAAHLAEVEVDEETGKTVVRRYFVVDDAGRIVNPMTAHGQVHGAVAQGIGGTLLEELRYSPEGQLLSSTFQDYLLPTSHDMPSVDIVTMETPSDNPGGFKGLGEGGAIGAPAAVTNAVADAFSDLAVDLSETPLTPERVARVVRDAKAARVGRSPP
ncbi:MAG: xanthine dehydrogenase family protein molybdopterin-binding subunit [Thermoplasmata archaeon]